ncbi:MAG: hypothetical protein JJT89_11985 [Nitriliruptoraceae bacterium]|nr:hypothetical protein [Nitriliruptoraceae bacterium]
MADGPVPAPRAAAVEGPAGHLDVEVARWLVGGDGRAQLAALVAQLDDGVDELAASVRLAGSLPPDRRAALLAAAVARRRARARWVQAETLTWTRVGLEQASDPAVAAWRARRFVDGDVLDLGCGLAGDAIAIAARARSLTAIDVDPARVVLATSNLAASTPRAMVTTAAGDALTATIPTGALVHLDPARRVGEQRIRDPRRTAPPVDAMLARTAATAGTAVVLAPGVDADHPALHPPIGAAPGSGDAVEVEYVQLGATLTEAVRWGGGLARSGVVTSATLLARPLAPCDPRVDDVEAVVHRTRSAPLDHDDEVARSPIGGWLLEPAPALIRARLVDDLARELGAARVAHHSALLTADAPAPSPWVRARPVLGVTRARPKDLARWLRANPVDEVEIAMHGIRGEVEHWWRQLGRPPRGPNGVRVELIRRDDDALAVITGRARAGGW